MAAASKKVDPNKPLILLRNKRVFHDYTVEDQIEAGLVLVGSEVKSLRSGGAQLTDAYIAPKNQELFLYHMKISEYTWSNQFNHLTERPRKLLLHRRQIQRLDEAVKQKGYTLLPLEVYSLRGKIKVLLGLCKGKRQYDKRADQKEKDAKRELARLRVR